MGLEKMAAALKTIGKDHKNKNEIENYWISNLRQQQKEKKRLLFFLNIHKIEALFSGSFIEKLKIKT